jgi:transcriptional repressor NrdR
MSIRRRRACQVCGYRFTTYERPAPTILVRKRTGLVEPFDSRKIRRGVESALADRPVPDDTIDRIIGRAEALSERGKGEVAAEDIGQVVLEELRLADEVAYLRFASVYKEFQGAADFEREVAALEEVPD